VAICFSFVSSFHRSALGAKTAAPYCRRRITKRAQTSCGRGRDCEAGQLPQFTPFVRHTLTGKGLRHSDGAGTPGTQRGQYHDDLHACAKSAGNRREESTRLKSVDRESAIARSARRPLPKPSKNYFFLCPTISPDMVRRSRRVRFFSIAGVSNEMCGISQRYSAMNHVGFSVVIQLTRSNRARFTGRE